MDPKNTTRKPHIVCVPFPAQGHVIPMMQLAKLLHSKGFCITFVNTEFNHRRLVRSKGEDWAKGFDDFWFETISDGLPPSNPDATQNPTMLCYHVPKHCLAPFRHLLAKLNSSPEVPPVTCIISDGVMSFALKAAEELGIPEVQFWTASACGFMAYLHHAELIQRHFPIQSSFVKLFPQLQHLHSSSNNEIFGVPDENFMSDGTLDTPVDWIPGMRNIRLKDLPSFIRTTDPNHIMFHLSNRLQVPHIYTIGPLSLLSSFMPKSQLTSFRPNFWADDSACLEWLDQRAPNSVIYANYGSVTVMSDQHLKEFAWGLANSKYSFLWIVRPDVVMGDSAVLPEEFLEETKGRGLLASWCVPVICWPFFAEQQTNCRYACTEWGIGMEVNYDVKRHDIEALVKEMMEGERGKEMKKNAMEWKKKAEEATAVGSSPCNNFDRFIKRLSTMDAKK
ncbi:hypothetical protein AAG906_002292 [Vitis piasezkii]